MNVVSQGDWNYRHKNPYHHRLGEFGELVLRDREPEAFAGRWNRDVFKRDAPLCLEIGCGYGHFMEEFCQDHPEINFIGLDYRFKRSHRLVKRLVSLNLPYWRYLRAKGERIPFMFVSGEVEQIFCFFPDPWHKRRHQKYRLLQEEFLSGPYKILAVGGRMFIKTDHMDYALAIKKAVVSQGLFSLKIESFDVRREYPDHFLSHYQTKFEKIFVAQNVPIKGFVLEKVA